MCSVVCVFDMGFAHKVEQKKASHVYGLRRLLLTASENDLHQRVHAQEIVVRLVLHLFRHVQQLDCIFFLFLDFQEVVIIVANKRIIVQWGGGHRPCFHV